MNHREPDAEDGVACHPRGVRASTRPSRSHPRRRFTVQGKSIRSADRHASGSWLSIAAAWRLAMPSDLLAFRNRCGVVLRADAEDVILQRQSVCSIDGRRSRSRVSGGAAWRLERFTRSVVVGYRRRGLPSRPHLLLQGQSVRAVHRYAVGCKLSTAARGWVAVQSVVGEQLHATPSSHRRRRPANNHRGCSHVFR